MLGFSSSYNSAIKISQVCITWFVFVYTGSALDVGIVAIVEQLAILLISLPTGVIMDRANKAHLMVLSGTMGFTAMMLLFAMSSSRSFDLIEILGLAALWGAGREIYRTGSYSTLPNLVPASSLSRANGIFRAMNSGLGSVFNAAAGGIILVLGVAAGFGFSAGGYALAVLFSSLIIMPVLSSRNVAGRETKPGRKMLSDLKEGFKWVVARRGFFLLTISATFFGFFLRMVLAFYVVYVVSGLNANSLVFGIVLGVLAAGDVSGALLCGRINLLRYSGLLNVVMFGGVTGISILIMGLFPSILNAILFTFIRGFGVGVTVNLWMTSAHNIVPEDMRGRYFAIDGVLSSLGPAAIAVGAVVIAYTGIDMDFIISGILLLVFTAVFLTMKSLITLDGRPGMYKPELKKRALGE